MENNCKHDDFPIRSIIKHHIFRSKRNEKKKNLATHDLQGQLKKIVVENTKILYKS